jgi:ankyrin repeat protein
MFDEFSKAVLYGDFDKVRQMVTADHAIINQPDKYGFCPLHNVMTEEQFDTVAYLIANGADVNIQNDVGITPLHLAAYPENAKLLLDAGAVIDIQDNNGNTPLHILAAEGRESYEVLEFLIQHRANKTLKNKEGKTALDIATNRNDRANMNLLQ